MTNCNHQISKFLINTNFANPICFKSSYFSASCRTSAFSELKWERDLSYPPSPFVMHYVIKMNNNKDK